MLHDEYKAIVDAGFLVQVDDAVLMHEADSIMSLGGSWDDYRKWAQLRVDALNHALRGLPEDRVRYHVCWGSWHGPHVYDPPLADVVDLILQVNAGQYAMEQANPRHEHEWAVWQDVKLPEGKKLIPGVVTHHTNVVEHPELVAQRPGPAGQRRRPRERARRHRLRLRPGRVHPARAPGDPVGQARGARRGRPDRQQAALGRRSGRVDDAQAHPQWAGDAIAARIVLGRHGAGRDGERNR